MLAGVVGVDPGIALRGGVLAPQRRMAPVDVIDVAHQTQDAVGEALLVELPPIQTILLGPLGALAEFLAHEQQLLTGVCPLVGEQAAQPGRLDVVVARHPSPQRALAVHHLVVAERQHVVLAEGVEHRERHLVVVVAAVYRVAAEVVERVVHPAHVPLHRKAQAAKVRRSGHSRPRRRLLGDGDDARGGLVCRRVHLLQELDGLQVFPSAVDVRASSRPRGANSPGTASTPPRPPGSRRCGTPRASTARWPPGSYGPPGDRSRTRKCPSRIARRARGSECS